MAPREIRIEGDLAWVPLTKGREAVIDAADVPMVADKHWHAQLGGKYSAYAVTNGREPDGRRSLVALHRFILQPPDGMVVDHIDGDGLNNRRSNLRVATRRQNNCNRGAASNNKSGFKGVFFKASQNKWAAQVKLAGKPLHLGYFLTKDEARAAYSEAAARLHGDFARVA